MTIRVRYITEKSSAFDSRLEAEIAEALEQADDLYLEDYKLRPIVTAVAKLITSKENRNEIN
jgi:hypothetical protein